MARVRRCATLRDMKIVLSTPEFPERWFAALARELASARVNTAPHAEAGHLTVPRVESPRAVASHAELPRAESPHAATSNTEPTRTATPSVAELYLWPDAPSCDYAVVWQPPAELFRAQPALKAVFSLGAGVDGILAAGSVPAHLPIVRVEDAGMAPQMAEYALYAALHHLREFDRYAQSQARGAWEPREMQPRGALSVGVLGLGALGSHVAQELARFGFHVLGWSRRAASLPGIECTHGEAGLAQLLSQSAVVIVLLPLTGATRGLLNADRLRLLPRGATVVNLARGPIIHTPDLLRALDEGAIGRAFLDVFDSEPLAPQDPLWTHPRATVTPHVAAQTPFEPAARQIVDKIMRLEQGDSVGGVVERSAGY